MIILSNPVNLYGRKVITDLATRTGNNTVDDFSYGVGLAPVVRRYWKNNDDSDANQEMLFNIQNDFDADIAQPMLLQEEIEDDTDLTEDEKVKRYDPKVDKTSFDRYYRRLEDVAYDYLNKYVGNMVYNIFAHSDGLKQYNLKHMVQPTLIGEDTDDFTELADLQLLEYNDDWSVEHKQSALQNLPYVIKRLHNMSCYTGIHMLSFIASYIKAKEHNVNMRIAGSAKSLKKNAVIEAGVYLCNDSGNIVKRVLVQNKNVRAAHMFDWICNLTQDYKAYYQDYLDFVHYCNVLNIDIINDDMTKYQKDFVDKLVVTTVTPNKQYDRQVFDAIIGNESNYIDKEEHIEDPIENTINNFIEVYGVNESVQDRILHFDSLMSNANMKLAQSLHNTYLLLSSLGIADASKYEWDNGYLHYDGELVTLPSSMFSDPNETAYYNEKCIIHELGYIIQITNNPFIHVINLVDAYANMENKVVYKNKEYKYTTWTRMGS